MKKMLFLIIIFLLITSGCGLRIPGTGGDCINVKKIVPAEVNVAKYKKIAVIDFDGKGGRNIAEWMETELQNAQVDGKPYFEIITRSQLLKLLGEQMLSLKGFVDPNTAARIGKISGTQAIVTGTVTAYRHDKGVYYRQVTRGRGKQQYVENVPCEVQSAFVQFTTSFIDSTSGKILARTSGEGQYIGDSCEGMDGLAGLLMDSIFKSVKKQTDNVVRGPIDVPERVINKASLMAIQQFVKKIAPHYQDVCIILKKDDTEGIDISFKSKPENEKQIENYYEIGYKYAIRGQWEDAITQWDKVLSIDQNRPAAIYNIGIANEMMGDLFLAEKLFKRVTEIKADDVFFDALARVRKSIEQQEIICKQTGKGCYRPPTQAETKTNRIMAPANEKVIVPSEIERDSAVIKETVVARAKPDSKAKSVGKISAGSKAERLDTKGDWIKIRVFNGEKSIEGWVHKCYIEGEDIKCPVKKIKEKKQEGKVPVSPM
ncbi:MAG: tetratricopeptide repeat protein [Nitrospira sp.]|nr:tetratricopeptide repeat protein [Nitrospira sp.]